MPLAHSLTRGLVVPGRSPSGFGNSVLRAMGQGMQSSIVGKNGGANIAVLNRTKHYSNVPFRFFRLVIPVFEIIGAPLVDTLLSGTSSVIYFQYGFEYPYAAAVTGIGPRIPVRFQGAKFVKFDAATQVLGYLISDRIDAGRIIPAGSANPFGLWGALELPAGVYSNALPYMITGTNFNERWGGQVFSGSSLIAGAGGGADDALLATSITKLGTTQSGVSGQFLPAFMLIECNENVKSVGALGDSITQGNNEGGAGSSTFGDSMGSALSNNGWLMRGIFETAGLNGFNLGKGSDGYKYISTLANWTFRQQLLALANPTHVIDAYGLNDVSAAITINGWASATPYTTPICVSSSSNLYMLEGSGTSGGVAPTGVGPTVSDGTLTWRYLGALPGTANPRGWGLIFAQMALVHDRIAVLVPRAKRLKTKVTPDNTSTDTFTLLANSTASTGWGDGTTRYGLLNAQIGALNSRLGLTDFIDGNLLIESATPGIWITDQATANYVQTDHSHPNSRGHSLLAPAVTGAKLA